MIVGAFSYGIAAAAFVVLALLLLTSWRGRLQGAALVVAVAISAGWAVAAALGAASGEVSSIGYRAAEVLRNIAWFVFLFRLLHAAAHADGQSARYLRLMEWGALILGGLVLAVDLLPASATPFPDQYRPAASLVGHLLLALIGLALVEQLFRNTSMSGRWAVKYLFIGVGGVFAYDFFFYSDAVLFKQLDSDLWQARGLVNALAAPLIAISAARNPAWSLDVFVSRKVVFHTVALMGAGLYLLVMAAAGYYIRVYGGTWGTTAQTAFLAFAVVLLLVLLFSGQMRARLKVFLSKHFFNYRYDYREEWLKLSRQLLAGGDELNPRQRAIRSLADIVDSTGGMLWTRTGAGRFQSSEHWNLNEPAQDSVRADDPMIRFLQGNQWIIDLDELRTQPELYDGLDLPDGLHGMARAWLIVPLMQADALIAFVVLGRPRAPRGINWEDRDLLKTVGLQIASYIALIEAGEALMSAQQFDAFNRLSSYVVHDLKNISAQLSLVTTNAKRHLHNPAFVEDAIATVENATNKMNRMLAQLRKGGTVEANKAIIELSTLVEQAVRMCSARDPKPEFRPAVAPLLLVIDGDRLINVLAHLIQNAQEATGGTGQVRIQVHADGDDAVIEVVDTGCGMDEEFIRNRLYRPFDTTKGNAGMGIGMYESREFVWSQGGDIRVLSEPGRGTTLRLRLPLYRDAPEGGRDHVAVEVSN